MATYTEHWLDYSITYDASGGERALVVQFPGKHELAGPPGTLIGLVDLTTKVLAAIDSDIETPISADYRWPPSGFFLSQTSRQRKDGPLSKYLVKDWEDREQTWYATIHWGKSGQNWYSSASMGVSLWRSLQSGLERMMANKNVREIEERSAVRAK